MRALICLIPALLLACGGEPPPKPEPVVVKPPPSDPLYPTGFSGWAAATPVTDDINQELRKFYRSPNDPLVYVKVHHQLDNPGVITGIDVRRKSDDPKFGGWEYLSFDPATRLQRRIDPEACHLCHAAAPENGTFSAF